MLWAFAKLGFMDAPLLHAIAAEAIGTIVQFEPQGLANMAWSCATLMWLNAPLMAAIATAAVAMLA